MISSFLYKRSPRQQKFIFILLLSLLLSLPYLAVTSALIYYKRKSNKEIKNLTEHIFILNKKYKNNKKLIFPEKSWNDVKGDHFNLDKKGTLTKIQQKVQNIFSSKNIQVTYINLNLGRKIDGKPLHFKAVLKYHGNITAVINSILKIENYRPFLFISSANISSNNFIHNKYPKNTIYIEVEIIGYIAPNLYKRVN